MRVAQRSMSFKNRDALHGILMAESYNVFLAVKNKKEQVNKGIH